MAVPYLLVPFSLASGFIFCYIVPTILNNDSMQTPVVTMSSTVYITSQYSMKSLSCVANES